MSGAITWHDGDLDAAFAQARAQQRPLFLYWGATWCPPCNRVKAEIFTHAPLAGRMADLLPFHLDGDSAGAQALAARYRLRSYPTLVLFAPDGGEITRLPCELDGEQFSDALDLALAAHRAGSNAAQALQAALSGDRALSADEWSLLAHYSWDTDEGQLLGRRDLAETLLALARACPQRDAAARLGLLAQLAAGASAAGQAPQLDGDTRVDALLSLFSDARLARANIDILLNSGLNLIKFAGRREATAAALSSLAAAWADDFWIAAPDRLAALRLQMRLSRLLAPTVGLQEQLGRRVVAALAESDDPHQRHTLVNTAVSALNEAGLAPQAMQLLEGELTRSHAPYYFMLSLAAGARRRGDTMGALDWYQQAASKALGAATRLQWGATYLSAVMELAPQDTARIEPAAQALAIDVDAAPDAFEQRNLSQLQRLAPKLAELAHAGPRVQALLSTIEAGLA